MRDAGTVGVGLVGAEARGGVVAPARDVPARSVAGGGERRAAAEGVVGLESRVDGVAGLLGDAAGEVAGEVTLVPGGVVLGADVAEVVVGADRAGCVARRHDPDGVGDIAGIVAEEQGLQPVVSARAGSAGAGTLRGQPRVCPLNDLIDLFLRDEEQTQQMGKRILAFPNTKGHQTMTKHGRPSEERFVPYCLFPSE